MRKIKNILVSQPRPATPKSPYFDLEEQYGVHIDFRQLIQVVELSTTEYRAQHINPLDYTAVLFNSTIAIDHYFHLMQELRLKVPEEQHYYCISEKVAFYLQKYITYRKRKIFYGNNRFEDVLPAMNRRPQEKYMMVVSDVNNADTINMFAEHGIEITPAVMFRTEPVIFEPGAIEHYDMYVLFTPTGVNALAKNIPENMDLSEHVLACYGPKTAEAIQAKGWRLDIQAPNERFQSITAAINHYLQEHSEEEDSEA